ncbi:hypothetical protein LSAT2_031563, partial [Lamellibrachia satsuma]
MSIYFDDATPGLFLDSNEGRVPDWVSGQLMMDLTGVSSIASEPTGPTTPSHFDVRDRFGSIMTGLSPPQTRNPSIVTRVGSTSPVNTFGYKNQHKPAPFCLDPLPKPPPPLFPISHENDTTSDDFTRHGRNSPKKSDLDLDWHNPFTSMTLSTTTGSLFRDEPLVPKTQERELEMRVKMIQAKFQEEKLKLQQKHDTNVQKLHFLLPAVGVVVLQRCPAGVECTSGESPGICETVDTRVVSTASCCTPRCQQGLAGGSWFNSPKQSAWVLYCCRQPRRSLPILVRTSVSPASRNCTVCCLHKFPQHIICSM